MCNSQNIPCYLVFFMHVVFQNSVPAYAWEMGSCWSYVLESETKYRPHFGTSSEDNNDRFLPNTPKPAWLEDKESFKLSGTWSLLLGMQICLRMSSYTKLWGNITFINFFTYREQLYKKNEAQIYKTNVKTGSDCGSFFQD